MTEVLKAGVLSDEIDLGALAHNAAEQAEEFVRKVSDLTLSLDNIIMIKWKNDFVVRYGKHPGKYVIIDIYQNGFKITISYIETIDHHCHRFVHVLNRFFESIPKPVTYGLIYWVVLLLSA